MKKSVFVILLAVIMSSFIVATAMACGCGKAKKDVSTMSCQCATGSCGAGTEEDVDNAGQVNNTICPVSGKPIGSMGEGVSHTYNGKVYKFCCAGCINSFKENPEEYINKIKTN